MLEVKKPNEPFCPVCRSSQVETKWSVSSKDAATHFVLENRDAERHRMLTRAIEELWHRNTCSVLRCIACEFCFADPFTAGDARFYSLAFDGIGYPSWKWEFQVTLDELKKNLRPNHRILELGAGSGSFVSRLLTVGVQKHNIVCTEYSRSGREKIERMGIQCLSEDIRATDLNEFGGKFDTICLFQVLEHLDNIHALFEKIVMLLNSGGTIYVAVPNPERIEFNETHGGLLDMPPNHVGRWGLKSFEVLANKFSLQISNYAIEPLQTVTSWELISRHRFLRATQVTGSLPNKIRGLKSRKLRLFLEIVATAFYGLLSIRTASEMTKSMGISQWIELKKIGSIRENN